MAHNCDVDYRGEIHMLPPENGYIRRGFTGVHMFICSCGAMGRGTIEELTPFMAPHYIRSFEARVRRPMTDEEKAKHNFPVSA